MNCRHGGDIYKYENVLDFSININPLGMSEKVKEAAKKGVDESMSYPDPFCRKLREKLSETLSVPTETILFGNGAAELIYGLVLAEKPKKALLPVPAFSEYERALKIVDCEIIYYQTKENNFFVVDKDILNVLTDDVDLLFLCSPSNPSGKEIKEELLLQVIEVCQQRGIRCVVDQCFLDFCRSESYLTEQMEQYSKLFLLRAFTKTYGIPGLRLGYGLTSDRQLVNRMGECCQPWNLSVPAQYAGIAALEEKVRVRQMRELVAVQRKKLERELRKLGIKFISSDVNFILLYSKINLFDRFLDFHILIRDCSNYRGLEKGWYRIAVRTERENQILLQALKQILAEGGE